MEYDLVFEGGGAKGMVFVGAMEEFERRGNTPGRLLGTSAGAITASLLAAGYTSAEMLAALEEKEGDQPVFVGFMGVPEPFPESEVAGSAIMGFFRAINLIGIPEFVEEKIDAALLKALSRSEKYRHLFSFVERGGWYTADRFITWLKQKLSSGAAGGVPRAWGEQTLSEFFATTGKELTLVACDTTSGRLLVLNHRTAPDCPVVWAVRMSMSIPLVWQEVEWKPEWGRYREGEMAGHTVVDGGLLSNFPIELLVSDEPAVTAVMGTRGGGEVLGMLIDEKLEVPDAPPAADGDAGLEDSKSRFRLAELKTVGRLKRLVNTMTQAHDKEILEVTQDLVLRLPAKGYGTTEFDMSEARRSALVAAGRQAMAEHLDLREKRAEETRGKRDLRPPIGRDRGVRRIAAGLLDG